MVRRSGPFSYLRARLFLGFLGLLGPLGCGPGVIGPGTDELMLIVSEPVESSLVAGVVNVRLTLLGASNLASVARVDIAVDDNVIASLTPSQTMVQPVDTRSVVDGVHSIAGRAHLTNGQVLTAVVGVRVDNTPPVVTIESPAGDSIYLEDGATAFRVMTAEPVARLILRVNDTIVADLTNPAPGPSEAPLDPMMLSPDGMPVDIVLSAEAVDEASNPRSTSKNVRVIRRELWFTTEDDARYGPVVTSTGAVALATADRLTIFEPDGMVRCRVTGAPVAAPLVHIQPNDSVFWGTLNDHRFVSATDCSIIRMHATTAGNTVTSAAFANGVLHAATFEGSLHTYAPDGTLMGTVSLRDAAMGDPTLEIGRALGVSPDGTIYVGGLVNTTSGAFFVVRAGMVEYRPMPAPLSEGLLATNEAAYVGGADGRLYKVTRELDRPWREDPELSAAKAIDCTPVAFDTNTIVVCDGDGAVHGISVMDGTTLWTYDASADRPSSRLIGTGGMAISPDGQNFALGDRLGMVHVLQRSGDRIALRWRAEISMMMTPISGLAAIRDRRLYVAGMNGLLVAYNL